LRGQGSLPRQTDDHGERGNGFAAFNKIRRAGLADHPLAVVRTPGGGFHLYFRGDPQRPQGNGSLPGHHIDFRGTGGYVLAPPSSVGGRRYEVVSHQPEAATVDFSAIRGLLGPPEAHPRPARLAGTQTDVERLAAHVERLQPGNRNGGLYWAASRAAEAGVLDDAAAERLIGAALTAGIRGGEREARRTVQSAQRGRGLDPTQRPQREREAG
jgi:bifunctional DNA primase/polymerase-like protein